VHIIFEGDKDRRETHSNVGRAVGRRTVPLDRVGNRVGEIPDCVERGTGDDQRGFEDGATAKGEETHHEEHGEDTASDHGGVYGTEIEKG
jgi:hypothetical protein